MKQIIIFFILIYITHPIIIICSQAAQSSLIPTFTWTNHRKNSSGEEQAPDQNFANIANLINVITHIVKESPVENHWIIASTNLPNFKQLKVQRTDLQTLETKLATYTMSIPADNNAHINTSIWGYYPCASHQGHAGLTPYTAAEFSQIFAQNNTQTSRILMPIIHCLTTASFTYAPQATIPTQPIQIAEQTFDNRFTYEQSKNKLQAQPTKQ